MGPCDIEWIMMNKEDIFTTTSAQDVPLDSAMKADMENAAEIQEGKKKGLWDRMWDKRRRGEKPLRKGQKGYPKELPESQLKELIQLMIREALNR